MCGPHSRPGDTGRLPERPRGPGAGCPKCGAAFQGAVARAERATAKDEEADEETAAQAGVELVSLDEVEAAEDKGADAAVDDIEVEDDGADDDAFLEEEEEDDDDVSSLIDGEIAPDEEG